MYGKILRSTEMIHNGFSWGTFHELHTETPFWNWSQLSSYYFPKLHFTLSYISIFSLLAKLSGTISQLSKFAFRN